MPFDQALRLTSVLLASAAFIGLVLGASLPEWLVLLTGSALILTLLRNPKTARLEHIVDRITLSTTAWNMLVIIAFIGFWMDLLWISSELLPAGVHFLLVLMVIKLFNLHSRRDYLHLYAISLMAILASAALTTDLWYLPVFLAYLLTGVWTLLLNQLTKESEDIPATASIRLTQRGIPGGPNQITPQFFWLANGLALGAFCLTVVIFFSIPRISAGFFYKSQSEGLRTSGFSETVDLGAIGPIKRDSSIVMRVELPDRPDHEKGRFYLRGMAYDRYDGRSWMNRLTQRRSLSEMPEGTFTVRAGRSRPSPQLSPGIRQNILLEVLDTSVLFTTPFAESISGQLLAVQSDPSGAIYLPFPSLSRIEYSVVSRPNPVLPADMQLQTAAYSESFVRHFLQLPQGSERVAAFAREIIQKKMTTYDKARAIEEYLSRNFRYSLDVAESAQERPLEEFLFNRKTGYCEHYATAMVVMLRTVGIPARLVTGFLASEWNEYGNYYLVRQRDAHAWVEIHLPQSGWITMDPTPAVSDGVEDPGWYAFSRMMDTLRLRWNRLFVQYNAADQLAVVKGLKESTEAVRTHAWNSLFSLLGPIGDVLRNAMRYAGEGNLRLLLEFLGLVFLGLGVMVWLVLKRPWTSWMQTKKLSPEGKIITQVYQKMIHYVARHGMAKPASATPLEFLRVVQRDWASASVAVATVTELYCRGRFGEIPLSKEELELAYQSLRDVKVLEPPIL
ncbi:MAG: transglutaminase TgpA family protein [Nitrospiraceae bacterium]